MDPDETTIMTPEEYRAAYLKAHGHPPPDLDDDNDLPDCECRTPARSVDLDGLRARAVEIAGLYDARHVAAGREPWTTTDLTMGFVGDVGDLAKLVMAVEGRRILPDAGTRLGHELADCLWSVLVLADRYGVDLAAEFTRMTDGIERNLGTNPE